MSPAIDAWLPKSVLLLRNYDRQKFVSDLIAGVTVGLVALPLLLCGAREQPAQLMKQAEFERHVGAENICGSITEALERAAEVYKASQTEKKAAELATSN
jgi:hypothetical protein